AVIRSAAAGAEGQGAPSAEAVVRAVHGPLRGRRALAVQAAFAALWRGLGAAAPPERPFSASSRGNSHRDSGRAAAGAAESAQLPVAGLRRRCAALELLTFAVKERLFSSAEEALQSLTRGWRGLKAVSLQEFAAAHILISAFHRGDDDFDQLLRRLWRLPP
ncbi:unnamed protein product, partial [Polarella glacialis]